MKLPAPPAAYDAIYERQRNSILERAVSRQHGKGGDLALDKGESIFLYAPGGERHKLSVDDNGMLTVDGVVIDAADADTLDGLDSTAFALVSGTYANLRAQATTKGDVGLGSVPNVDATVAANVAIADAGGHIAASDVEGALQELASSGGSGRDIGEVFALFDNITGVSAPDNSGTETYIKLTAGEDGAGQYNEGLLTSESVSGSSPTITATAQISHAASPMDGQTVRLINTEERFLRAGNAGVTQDSQFAAHSHQYTPGWNSGVGSTRGGGNGAQRNTEVVGGNETRPRNVGITYYMRIA